MNNWPYMSYSARFARRADMFNKIKIDASLQIGAKEHYKTRPVEFINDWLVTYDPRNASKDIPTIMPFVLFPRQVDLVVFINECLADRQSGLIEKARDMGATWVLCAYSVWAFLFLEGVSIGWGSRKEQLVDKIGDPDSIFEKLRTLLRYTPKFFLPVGFDIERNCSYMKIVNPVNGSTITGEAGSNIGRGGRKTIFFKDESAHYERPEKIEAALGDNTDVQIDFSSVNGTGNVFHRRRLGGTIWDPEDKPPKGTTRIFILDWRDHPLKTQEWYDTRREKASREGLLNLFSQEVDRDYSGNVDGILIPAQWVQAAIDLHKRFDEPPTGKRYGALDPADPTEGSGDAHGFIARQGAVILHADMWHMGDTGDAARKSVSYCKQFSLSSLQFDGTGVGAGVRSETNRMQTDKTLPSNLYVHRWMGGSKVLFPKQHIIKGDKESPKNEDFYKNLKAQAWWELRLRFERSYKYVTKGEKYPYSELISIPSDLPHKDALVNELSQPTCTYDNSGKILINKKPPGTKSPNLGDSCTMAFWPCEPVVMGRIVGGPGGFKTHSDRI